MSETDFLIKNKLFYNIELTSIRWFRYASIIIIILYFIGIFSEKSIYLMEISFIFKILIALFLIYRFNEYRKKITFTELDREAAFVAGEHLILISFVDILSSYTELIRPKITMHTQPIINKIKEKIL